MGEASILYRLLPYILALSYCFLSHNLRISVYTLNSMKTYTLPYVSIFALNVLLLAGLMGTSLFIASRWMAESVTFAQQTILSLTGVTFFLVLQNVKKLISSIDLIGSRDVQDTLLFCTQKSVAVVTFLLIIVSTIALFS